MKSLKRPSKKILFPALLVLIILGIVAGVFAYKQMQAKKNPTVAAQNEISSLVGKVGKLIDLPTETPTVATVSDISKLHDQAFFAKAKNGDKVLIYANSKKAILYRPSDNKIIEVAVYNPGTVTPVPSVSTPAPGKVKVSILNGTKTAGLAKTEQASLENKFSNIEVIGTGNAVSDYTKTTVIDLSGTNKDIAKSLATELSGEVGTLPSGEDKPVDAQILIILGAK